MMGRLSDALLTNDAARRFSHRCDERATKTSRSLAGAGKYLKSANQAYCQAVAA